MKREAKQPLVSVILTCYNREKEIVRALNSVKTQAYDNLEIIVVDDASSDKSCEAISTINDSRIRLLIHDINKGQNAAINTGLRFAKGQFIAFLDSDDIWFPEYLSLMVDSFSENIGFVYTWLKNGPKSYLSSDASFEDVLNQGFLSSMISIVVRAECMDKLVGFDENSNMRMSQDDQFCFELARLYKFKLVPGFHAIAIGAENSITNDLKAVALGREFFFNHYYDEILEKCGARTIAKYKFEIANLKILGGMWRASIADFCMAIGYLFLPAGLYKTPSLKDVPKKIGGFSYYLLKRLHLYFRGRNA